MAKSQINRLLRIAKKKLKVPKTPTQKKAYIEKQAKKMSKNLTGPEKKMVKIFKALKIIFEPQKIVHGKIFDFYIPSVNLLVESDGDYYHAYDKTYLEMNEMQRRSVRNDSDKDVIAVGLGYGIIRFWEHDLNDNPQFVKDELLKKIESIESLRK